MGFAMRIGVSRSENRNSMRQSITKSEIDFINARRGNDYARLI